VLSVHAYDDVGEVIDDVNKRPSPLAAYWYGPTGEAFATFRRHVQSGGMTINDFALHCAMPSPFGGVGESGYGAYHGKAGFDCFTHRRTVTHSRLPFSMAQLMVPPFAPRLAPALEWQVRRARRLATRRTGRVRN
jgi:coniferyl-aldehyde dehydrogenase